MTVIKAINETIKDRKLSSKDISYLSYMRLIKITELSTDIKYLYCDGNQLTSLPTLPTELTHLSCHTNHLTSLPTLPTELKELYCHGNQLTSLPTLPTRLIYLSCNGNQLTFLPDLRTCIKLEFVDCDLKNFEPYMLDMENVYFDFFC